jgi:hypothetical protein
MAASSVENSEDNIGGSLFGWDEDACKSERESCPSGEDK